MNAYHVKQRSRIRLLQVSGGIVVAMILFTQPLIVGRSHQHVEMFGLSLLVVCIAGRIWSTLYIGSKKNRELVTVGPYSITRNPLYLSSTIGAAGIGLVFGSVAVAAGLAIVSYGILRSAAKREAAHLREIFGRTYKAYAARTPLFWPRLSLYRDWNDVTFDPKALYRTFIDSLLFLIALPVHELIEYLQAAGTLPILVRIF